MATASRTFVDLEILKNSDFDQSINFNVNYSFTAKDYELSIAADYSTSAVVTLKSDDVEGSGVPAARLTTAQGTSTTEGVLTIHIPAIAGEGGGCNTFKTGDFADGFEGTYELLERSSDGIVTRQAEGDVVVRSAVTGTFDYDA
jgi:hypothetical protein